MNGIIKNALVLLGLFLVVGLGYFLYSQNLPLLSGGDDATVITDRTKMQAEQSLRRLNELKDITIREELFSDIRFTNLKDFSSQPTPLSIGNPYPFSRDN